MSATARCMALVVTLGLGAVPALAQETSPQRMGEFLGFVLMCGCLPYESSHQSAAFYALMVEEEGERYADTAAGYMRRIENGSYRNTATVCSGYICHNDYTIYLGEILAMIDLETEPDTFMEAYEKAYGTGVAEAGSDSAAPVPSWCAWHTFHPDCADSR